jgi:hypothetical protein
MVKKNSFYFFKKENSYFVYFCFINLCTSTLLFYDDLTFDMTMLFIKTLAKLQYLICVLVLCLLKYLIVIW